MADGGFFKGRSFREDTDPPETERAFAILWGKIVGQPEDRTINKRVVSFIVKYHSHRSYMRCETTGDSDALRVMAAMEPGDMVLCFGEWHKSIAHTKKGDKEIFGMRVAVILPMALVPFLLRLASSSTISGYLEAEDNEAADKHSWDDE